MTRIVLMYFLLISIVYPIEYIGKNINEKITSFSNPIDIEVKEDSLYIMDYVLGKIVIYDNNLKPFFQIKNLKNPLAFSVYDNKIYVSESNENRIIIYDMIRHKRKIIGKYGIQEKEFSHPGRIYKYAGKFYVFDEYNYRIQILDSDYVFLEEILLPRFEYVYKPSFELNYSMVFLKDEIYILDSYNKKLYLYKNEKKIKSIDLYFLEDAKKVMKIDGKIYLYDSKQDSFFNIEGKEEFKLDFENENYLIKSKVLDVKDYFVYYIKNNTIAIYNSKTKKKGKYIEYNLIEKSEYIEPVDIKTDKYGNKYILDKVLSKILIYDKYGEYKNTINDIGDNASGIFIDKNMNIYVAVAGENRIRRYNKFGKMVYNYGGYEKFPLNQQYMYDNIEEEEKPDLKLIDKKIYNMKVTLDENGYIYILDSKDKKIKIYDQFFRFMGDFGKKADIVSIVREKENEDSFGWDEYNNDSLRDIFYYEKGIYVLDSYYSKIILFKNRKIEKIYKVDSLRNSLEGIYVDEKGIYIADKLNYKIIFVSHDGEEKREISLLDRSLMPYKINGNYILVLKSETNFNESYFLLDIKELLTNDRD